jgi:hypothetical protein
MCKSQLLPLPTLASHVRLVSPVLPAHRSSVDLPRMVFLPRTRLWLPTCHMISARRRYIVLDHHIYLGIANEFSQLKELFAAYKPTAAKIALRPIPRFMVKKLIERNEPRKGRGFGFVTLESEEMQQKAVSEMNGKMIEEREIAVKVAIDSPGKEDADPQATGVVPATENGVAQATAAPATTA